MPRKPAKPCAVNGCPNLTHSKYCEVHDHLRLDAQKDYNRDRRSPDVVKAYGSKWRKARALHVQAFPYCEQCYKEGRIVPVDEVHHIIPVRDGGTHDQSNLMSLCRSCHSKTRYK